MGRVAAAGPGGWRGRGDIDDAGEFGGMGAAHDGAEPGLELRGRAPASMVRTGTRRRPALDPVPPAWELSAAMPVSVRVRTVVVRSGTAMARAAAFWIPMQMPRAAMRAYR
jgi:hypothetical protein